MSPFSVGVEAPEIDMALAPLIKSAVSVIPAAPKIPMKPFDERVSSFSESSPLALTASMPDALSVSVPSV